MVKAKTNKTKNGPESRLDVLLRVGDYAAIRRMEGPKPPLEPNPLVFWIGIGSVAVAMGLAFLLLL
jgi:hypothetical protein